MCYPLTQRPTFDSRCSHTPSGIKNDRGRCVRHCLYRSPVNRVSCNQAVPKAFAPSIQQTASTFSSSSSSSPTLPPTSRKSNYHRNFAVSIPWLYIRRVLGSSPYVVSYHGIIGPKVTRVTGKLSQRSYVRSTRKYSQSYAKNRQGRWIYHRSKRAVFLSLVSAQ